ncbi:hypothetical protein JVU11DRAFT_2727 [Chiua virens]|nr:hypothetical protein JVU11DRAFT_2727 [Chiua virens]
MTTFCLLMVIPPFLMDQIEYPTFYPSLSPQPSLLHLASTGILVAHVPQVRVVKLRSSNIVILSSLNSQPDSTSTSIHDRKPAPVGSTDPVMPTSRHKCTDADRSLLSASRRQGRVFHFEPPVGNASRPDALELDKTFLDPREPPPKPISNLTANRCSSLDRLECSLMKLEAYGPYHHRKSQSDERAPVRVAHRSDKRPSLPPPRRLKKPQSSHDIAHCNRSHPAYDCLPSGHPFPKQMPVRPCNTPGILPVASLNHEDHEHTLTPGSFMDMDITCAEEASRKRQDPVHHAKNKEKMKGLVGIAKRVSQGVIAWGKNLTGSTKPSNKVQDTVTAHNPRF